jgi:ribosomal-protein-alanine N-acetyltransferase
MQILESERMVLRRLERGDLPDLYALYRDEETRRYFPEGTLTLVQTEAELVWFANDDPAHPGHGLWATLLKPSGQFIGRCGLLPWTLDGRDETEVAFLIDKKLWGHGLATEAAQAISRHAFDVLHLKRLICLIVPGNEASRRVAMKIGMRHERDVDDEHGRSWLYSMQAPCSSQGAGDASGLPFSTT